MKRNSSIQAITLSTHPVGEASRLATFLSPQKGLFTAMVFGGRKGKLKSLVSPFHSGTLWLYEDKAKNSIKVCDFDVTEYRCGIRENLYKTCSASLAAELIIKTSAGAENNQLWTLLKGYLDGLHLVNENEAKIGTLRFLWRYLELLGLQSDCFHCSQCLQAFETPLKKEERSKVKEYSIQENGFLCADCITEYASFKTFPISKEALYYLQLICSQNPKTVRENSLSASAYNELHELLFFLIEQAAERKLQTLIAGRGIL